MVEGTEDVRRAAVLAVLVAWANGQKEAAETVRARIRVTFGCDADDDLARGRDGPPPAGTEECFLEVAAALPAPRDHEDRRLLHLAARALDLDADDVSSMARRHPRLKVFEPAKERSRAAESPTLEPLVLALPAPSDGSRAVGALAVVAMALGLLAFFVGLAAPALSTRLVMATGEFRIDEELPPEGMGSDEERCVLSFPAVAGRRYEVLVSLNAEGLKGRDVALQHRLRVAPVGGEAMRTYRPTGSRRARNRAVFALAGFTAAISAVHTIELEAASEECPGTAQVTVIHVSGRQVGGSAYVLAGLLLVAAGFGLCVLLSTLG